jgi:hypothetical protein
MPWPTSAYSVHALPSPDRAFTNQPVHGFLIGDDCPSFPSYETAFQAFFYGDFSPAPGRGGRSEFALVRVVDGTGWIERSGSRRLPWRSTSVVPAPTRNPRPAAKPKPRTLTQVRGHSDLLRHHTQMPPRIGTYS